MAAVGKHPRSPRPPGRAPSAPDPEGGATPERRALPIAVFDSGVGGLTVLHECLVSLPHEDFVYLGDTARFPYGDRPLAELREFALELGERLVDGGAKLLVVACNSATAAALPTLRESLEGRVPVLGVVGPESRAAASATSTGRIGLLATAATVASGAYAAELAEASPNAALTAVSCPRLAPLIESGEIDERLVDTVEAYCAPLRDAEVDTVILGCTHYPLVRPILHRALGRGARIVTAGEALAREVERELAERDLANDPARRGEYRFLCSGDPEVFRRVGARFLQMPLGTVARVPVGGGPATGRAAA